MPDLPAPFDRRPAHVAPVETPGLKGLLTVAVAVVVIAGLYLGRSVLIPITLAILLSFLLAPVVTQLRRLYLGRVLSVLVAVLLALAVILAVGGLVGSQLASLAEEVPRYATTIQQKVDTLRQFLLSRVTSVTRELGHAPLPVEIAGKAKPSGASQALTGKPGADREKPVQVEVHQPDMSAIELAQRILAPVVEPLSTTAIVLTVSIFILLQREDLRDRMIRLFGSSDLHRTTLTMNDAARRLSRYLLSQFAVNASFGTIVGVGLAVIGIPSPVMWGILGGLLRFVPYVGAPLSAVIPLALAAAIDPGWSLLLWTLALYLVVEAIVGQAVEPLLYSRTTGLSPFAVVVAATFWAWLWGPIGLILSTPMTLCLVVLGRHVARLEFLDVLLGDRPALTPVESFYQRMLAGDPDEARDQAEILLKAQPLSAYYDEVAVKGLRLAVTDVERGVLTSAHLERIKVCVQSLIEDLDDHEDPDPAAAVAKTAAGAAENSPGLEASDPPGGDELAASGLGNTTTVLCISGRGLLDDAVSTMLAQLLEKRGLAPRVVPFGATARGAIGTLDVNGVDVVCINYLELSGSPSHLRYLLRRLRVRLSPGVEVIVGLWPEEEEILHDERLRAAIGADRYTVTLNEAVANCIEIANKTSLARSPPLLVAAPAAA